MLIMIKKLSYKHVSPRDHLSGVSSSSSSSQRVNSTSRTISMTSRSGTRLLMTSLGSGGLGGLSGPPGSDCTEVSGVVDGWCGSGGLGGSCGLCCSLEVSLLLLLELQDGLPTALPMQGELELHLVISL